MIAPSLLAVCDPSEVSGVVLGFEQAISKSFADDLSRMTGAEVRRRFEICTRLFCALRADLRWGLQRALDQLPQYLRCELDGARWEPDARTIWMPHDE